MTACNPTADMVGYPHELRVFEPSHMVQGWHCESTAAKAFRCFTLSFFSCQQATNFGGV